MHCRPSPRPLSKPKCVQVKRLGRSNALCTHCSLIMRSVSRPSATGPLALPRQPDHACLLIPGHPLGDTSAWRRLHALPARLMVPA